jgi:hypothetical protein
MCNRLGESALLCAGIVIAGHLFEGKLMAGKPFRGGLEAVRWRDGRVRMEISREVHTGGEAGVAAGDSAAEVHRAVADAVRAWMRTGVAAIEVEMGLSAERAVSSGVNLVTFTDTAPFDSGLCDRNVFVACTILRYDELTGEIQGAAVAFNPYKRHSATGIAGTHDIGLVMLHEMGHVLGLDHSAVLDAAMNPEVEVDPGVPERAMFPVRRLSSDDRLTAAVLYPAAPLGQMRGTVSRDGAPVAGAHVVAIDRAGRPVVGAITGPEGGYQLAVSGGEYLVAVEPLDGPVVATQFCTIAGGGQPFPTRFWSLTGGTAEPSSWEPVEAGATREGLDFVLPAAPVLNVSTVGVIENGSYWGTARTQVERGGRYTLAVTRNPEDGPASLSVLGEGWVLEGAATSPAGAPQLLRQRISVNSEPGSYVLAYRHEEGVSLLAGGIAVVPNPKVEAAVVAGGLLVIRGTGLGSGEVAAERITLDGVDLPGPAQLGGVSVRSGGRWLRLRSVSPGEIVAEVPEGGLGGGVTVVTGSGAGAGVEVR